MTRIEYLAGGESVRQGPVPWFYKRGYASFHERSAFLSCDNVLLRSIFSLTALLPPSDRFLRQIDCTSPVISCLAPPFSSQISVANLGDSKCVLARLVNGQVCAVPLSHDHKPDRPDERQRILAIGGQVMCLAIKGGGGGETARFLNKQ